jgi:nitrite reductase/ring-hydroxylating ferredoxin subunit
MKKLILITIVVLYCCSCDKNNYEFPIANVNLYLYPNNLEFNGLHIPGNSAKIEGGVNGILIFHDFFDNYIAFDRACTNDPLNSCEQIDVDTEQTNNLNCSCCESEFFIFDGAVINGPAEQALFRYQTTFDGVRLRVFN